MAEHRQAESDAAFSNKPDDWDAADNSNFADDDGGDFGGDDSDYA